MKKIFGALVLVTLSIAVHANSNKTETKRDVAQVSEEGDIDCKNAMSQAEMTYCAHQRLGESSKKLEDIILKKCLKAPSVVDFKGGSGYNMMVASCQADLYNAAIKAVRAIKPQ